MRLPGILSLVACTPIDTSYSTLDLYSLLFIGLPQKTVQALMMKLRVGQKVICQQVKMNMRILQKMGYQYQLHRVMELTSSGIGYRRRCSRLPATSTLCSLYLQMDPKINKVGANLHFTKSHINYLSEYWLFKLVHSFCLAGYIRMLL